MKRITNNLLALIVTLACWTLAGAYQVAGGHISSPWAETIDVDHVWNEYPRPLMQRN